MKFTCVLNSFPLIFERREDAKLLSKLARNVDISKTSNADLFVLYDYFSLFTYLTYSLSFVLTGFCQGAFGRCYKLLRVSFQHYIL